MKIAIYNGFLFHYEMYGYIIHYCKEKKYDLTIFSAMNPNISDNNFLDFYKKIDLFFDYHFEVRKSTEFYNMFDMFDIVFLITDDDSSFDKSNLALNRKVICIEHFFLDRCPSINNKIATRPFDSNYYRDWALPCYPITNKKYSNIDNKNCIYIAIVGTTYMKYNTNVMNRIKHNNKKIGFIVIGRDVNINKFQGIDKDIDLSIYQNIDTIDMMNLVCSCDFLLADSNMDIIYEDKQMTGSIPLAFSLLVPLIISKQTNRFYQFENVIEFDKSSCEDISLINIDIDELEKERDIIIKHNFDMFDKHIEMIL